MLDFHRSADVLLVLVIGGTGWLYGGIVGAIVFKLLQDVLSPIDAAVLEFWIGLFLVVLVLVGRERLSARPWTLAGARAARDERRRCETHGLVQALRRHRRDQRRLASRSSAARAMR